MKSIYLIQPYQLGGKYKSLALIIPADIVRECNINKSTGFSLRVDKETKKIVLNTINFADKVHRKQLILMNRTRAENEVNLSQPFCCSKNCKNKAIVKLPIKYIKKSGWFCSQCADEMKQSQVIEGA